jgi:hypothetical protein
MDGQQPVPYLSYINTSVENTPRTVRPRYLAVAAQCSDRRPVQQRMSHAMQTRDPPARCREAYERDVPQCGER